MKPGTDLEPSPHPITHVIILRVFESMKSMVRKTVNSPFQHVSDISACLVMFYLEPQT